MKYLKILFLILIITRCSSIDINREKIDRIKSSFPKLEEILTHIDNQYFIPCDTCAFDIAKKETGYYLTKTIRKEKMIDFFSKSSKEQKHVIETFVIEELRNIGWFKHQLRLQLQEVISLPKTPKKLRRQYGLDGRHPCTSAGKICSLPVEPSLEHQGN